MAVELKNTTVSTTADSNTVFIGADSSSASVPKLFGAAAVAASALAGQILGPTTTGPAIKFDYATFNGTQEQVLQFGYNQTIGGVSQQAGEPGLGWFIEGNYNDNSGQNKMESYLQYCAEDGSRTTRPIFFSINRATKKINLSIVKGDTIKFLADDDVGEAGSNTFTFAKNALTLHAPDTSSQSSISVLAATGQPAVLALGYNAVTNVLTMFPQSAAQATIQVSGTSALYLFNRPNGGAASGAISVGVGDNSAMGVFDAVNATDTVATIIARAKSSQTAITFQVQDSASALKFGVSKAGLVFVADQSAPSTPTGGGHIYVESGALKYKGSSGTVTVLASA